MKYLKKIFVIFAVSTSVCFYFISMALAQEKEGVKDMDTVKKIIDLVIEYSVKYSFQVLGGVIILIAAWIIAKIVANMVKDFLFKKKLDITISKFIASGVKFIIMIFAGMIALAKFGIEIAPIIAGLSVVGVGVGLAMQGTLSNYAAGISLIFTKPFKVGDIVEVADEMGEIEDITLPRTIMKTVDGTMIYIPNKHIIGEIIHNFSELKRLDIKVGVDYKTDIEKAVNIIKEVVKNESRVVSKPEPKIGVSDFGDSSINLYARVFCKQADYWDTMFSVNKKILDAFRKQEIAIPFPRRDVHLYQEK